MKQKKPRKLLVEAKKSINKKQVESPSRNELALLFAKMESKKIKKRNEKIDIEKKINLEKKTSLENEESSGIVQSWSLNEKKQIVVENSMLETDSKDIKLDVKKINYVSTRKLIENEAQLKKKVVVKESLVDPVVENSMLETDSKNVKSEAEKINRISTRKLIETEGEVQLMKKVVVVKESRVDRVKESLLLENTVETVKTNNKKINVTLTRKLEEKITPKTIEIETSSIVNSEDKFEKEAKEDEDAKESENNAYKQSKKICELKRIFEGSPKFNKKKAAFSPNTRHRSTKKADFEAESSGIESIRKKQKKVGLNNLNPIENYFTKIENGPKCKIIRSDKRKLSDFVEKTEVLDGSFKEGIYKKKFGDLDRNERGKRGKNEHI